MRAAVVGAGVMGSNHARVYEMIRSVEVVAIVDVDVGRARDVAQLYGGRPYARLDEMLRVERPDLVSIAVPTREHHAVVETALLAGCHVLVEKPIAATCKEGFALVALARERDRILMVGHIERYNPAVIELLRRLKAGELGRIFQVTTRRLGPFPPRIRDVGVVIDLATHDLDIICKVVGAKPVRVYAETRRRLHTTHEDLFFGSLRFADDTVAHLEINWLTPTKIRELTVTGERGMFRIDYLTQDLYFYSNAEVDGATWSRLGVLRGVSEGAITRFAVPRMEPLRAEIEAFVAASGGMPAEVVTGEEGLVALTLAEALLTSAAQGHPQELPSA